MRHELWLWASLRRHSQIGQALLRDEHGPVNALDAALRFALRRHFADEIAKITLTDYKVRVLDTGRGTGAVTRVLLESTNGVETWSTMGVSENIIEASWQALADSVVYGLLHPPT